MSTIQTITYFWAGCAFVVYGIVWAMWACLTMRVGGPLLPIAAVLIPHAFVPITLGGLFLWRSLHAKQCDPRP